MDIRNLLIWVISPPPIPFLKEFPLFPFSLSSPLRRFPTALQTIHHPPSPLPFWLSITVIPLIFFPAYTYIDYSSPLHQAFYSLRINTSTSPTIPQPRLRIHCLSVCLSSAWCLWGCVGVVGLSFWWMDKVEMFPGSIYLLFTFFFFAFLPREREVFRPTDRPAGRLLKESFFFFFFFFFSPISFSFFFFFFFYFLII